MPTSITNRVTIPVGNAHPTRNRFHVHTDCTECPLLFLLDPFELLLLISTV